MLLAPRSAFIVLGSNRRQFYSVSAVVLLLARCSIAQPITGLPSSSVVSLFNGTNLQGFYTWLVDSRYDDPRKVFSVTNGMGRISGEGLGYLATRQAYGNYRLVTEFKWGPTNWYWGGRIGAARDSGIFLHATGPDGNSHDGKGAFKTAIECQVMQGAVGDLLLIRGTNSLGQVIAPSLMATVAERNDSEGWPYWARSAGRSHPIVRWGRLNWFGKDPQWQDKLGFRGRSDIESSENEWTRVECVCESNRVSVFVNGTLVNQASEVFPSTGQILLQCEGSEIYFRKLELHPLTKSVRQE